MIVIDAWLALEIVLDPALESRLRSVLPEPEALMHAPAHIDVELAQALRNLAAGKILTSARASEAFADYRKMRIVHHPLRPHLDRIWELRNNHSSYDAAYIALAEHLSATLLTRDAKLAKSRHHAAVVRIF